MIRAVFEQQFSGFFLSGHAGYAASGSDIVCAAVSAMTNLVCNAAEAFGAEAEICEKETEAFLSYQIKNGCAEAEQLLMIFYEELKQLESQYPDYIRVQKNDKGVRYHA